MHPSSSGIVSCSDTSNSTAASSSSSSSSSKHGTCFYREKDVFCGIKPSITVEHGAYCFSRVNNFCGGGDVKSFTVAHGATHISKEDSLFVRDFGSAVGTVEHGA